jgi:hypothetical protein
MPAPADRLTPATAARPTSPPAAAESSQGAPAGGPGVWLWPVAIWIGVTAATLAARPPMVAADLPIHAAGWWAWTGRPDIAYLPNGGAEWPPLLFWCIRLGWSLFGVSETWVRLVPSVFGLVSLWLIAALARALWPRDADARHHAPIILAGTGGFIAFLATTAFAWPLLAWSILALHGIVLAWRQRPALGWTIYAAALALGELSAGAMAFWIMLPAALMAPAALRGFAGASLRNWYLGAMAATVAGMAAAGGLALATAARAATADMGDVAERVLLWGLIPSTAEDSSLWRVFVLAVVLYPWLWWTSLWRAVRRARDEFASGAFRLCLGAAAIVFLVVLVGGRQSTDLLPLLAPLALVVARVWSVQAGKARDFHAALPGLMALFVCLFFFMLNIIPVAHLDAVWNRLFDDSLPVWLGGISLVSGIMLLSGSYLLALLTPRANRARLIQLALLPVLLALTVNLEFTVALRPFFDVAPIAQKIRELERSGRLVAVYGEYHGEFDLPGRLTRPPHVLPDVPAALAWAEGNPDGAIVSFFRGGILHLPDDPLYLGHSEDARVALWASPSVTASRGAVLRPRF